MLILNSEQIKNSVSILDVLSAVEKAFLLQETGDYLMPDRMHVENRENVLLLMPAFAGNYFSTKLVSVFPENVKKGEPFIYGAVLLNDGSTGKPIAVLDGSMLTGLRTGAVGGLGIAYTSPKEASRLGLIGAGFQGFHQILFACTVRNITTVNIYDPFSKNIKMFISDLKKYLPHIVFTISNSSDELVSASEIIITATTSQMPVISSNPKLLEGKHFIGLGSFTPVMREFPDSLFSLTEKVIIDTDLAIKESGDLKIPLENKLIDENQFLRLGQLINGDKKLDTSKTTFFKSVGMALFDLMAAETIYKKAIDKGIGTEVDF